ncbi:hypothetical protein LENED_000047 [Lentinula edodes]|uniref:Uncharacterized protein n=1 Tax=Lentinula edodes TaxID=5353 RepID=A0A1Q3DUJ6_LENED|nr:hypothetical protein LENED_000047 [Lentinula edodes]
MQGDGMAQAVNVIQLHGIQTVSGIRIQLAQAVAEAYIYTPFLQYVNASLLSLHLFRLDHYPRPRSASLYHLSQAYNISYHRKRRSYCSYFSRKNTVFHSVNA